MAWISVHEQVMGGKLHRFAKRAGCSKKEALGILVGMWLWGINNADAVGRLDEMDKSDVADAISSGLSEGLVPSKIVDAMLDIGFLDMDGDTASASSAIESALRKKPSQMGRNARRAETRKSLPLMCI